jgi:putative DeoR family transcriptional regulator (stage III sporulation protein D)
MKADIEDRVIRLAHYIIQTRYTIREAAHDFKYSKASAHKDLKERLPKINKQLSDQIKLIMQDHIEHRYVNGGNSTKLKYEKLRKIANEIKI